MYKLYLKPRVPIRIDFPEVVFDEKGDMSNLEWGLKTRVSYIAADGEENAVLPSGTGLMMEWERPISTFNVSCDLM